MDKSPKGEAGQCQETTKVQGRKKKNSKFWNSLLLQLQWSRKGSLDRIEWFFFPPKQVDRGSALGRFTSRAPIKSSV